MKTFNEFLIENDACEEGMEWVNGRELSEIWNEFNRGDWMLWLLRHLGLDKITTVRIACKIVRVQCWELLTDERSKRAIEVAELWCDGKVTIEEVEAAVSAAWAAWAARSASVVSAASAAWAASAVWAAWAVRSAWAACAAWAASAESAAAHKQQCDIIREFVSLEHAQELLQRKLV